MPDEVDDAKADLVERIKDNPADIEAHADLLRMQIKSGDVEGAMGTVTHALKNNERDYRAHLLDAQFHRWQLNLLDAEKSLRRARGLASDRLEPCVALAGLYNQACLHAEEVKIRQIALGLAPPDLKPEFMLDLGFCQWQARNAEAAKLIDVSDATLAPAVRARASIMYAELALTQSRWEDAVRDIRAAYALDPENVGVLQFAARTVTVLENADGLGAMFDETLAGKDRAELRWTALFGHWMLALRKAADLLSETCENWRKRLEAMEPGHPDVTLRYYQLLKLRPDREAEAKKLAEDLQAMGLGAPPAPGTPDMLRAYWRAEDALRTGAPNQALVEITRVQQAEPDLEGLRMMRVMALFTGCEFEPCLKEIDAWLAESKEADEVLLSTRWVILLRTGKPGEVLADIQKRELKSNAAKWFEAVGNFQTYRQP